MGYIKETYDYIDETGRLLSQTVRFEPKDFRQRRPDPDSQEIGEQGSENRCAEGASDGPEECHSRGRHTQIFEIDGVLHFFPKGNA